MASGTPAPPPFRATRRYSIVVALVGIALVAAGGLRMVLPVSAVAPGNAAFAEVWARPDGPVADGLVSRTWIWGPEANSPIIMEPYWEAPGGLREVQYFDKSRMEITDPNGDPNDIWYVTNGLLVMELVSGRMQTGDNRFEEREPAEVNVAGDPDDPDGVTYATIAGVQHDAPLPDNATITWRLARDGTVTLDQDLADYGVTVAHHVSVDGIDHQVAAPFWEFMNSSGTVYIDGQPVVDQLFPDPFYATGYPVSEAYWAEVLVAGEPMDVLIQCFQRRCLTYTPANDPAWRVENGNVGQHYRIWRTNDPTPDDPTATPTATEPGEEPTQPTQPGEPTSTTTSTWQASPTSTGTIVVIQCDAAYPDFCIPPPPPDLDCDDFNRQNFAALPPDPHNLDPDDDGVACESTPPTATATATATATSTEEAEPTATEGEDENVAACLSPMEAEFIGLINDYRESLGLSPLRVSRALNIASYKHSADMAERNYFAHETLYPLPPGQSGPLPWDRMADAGYDYNTYKAENIARGYSTAQQVFTGWKNSDGHDKNMRSSNYKAIGIGLVYDSSNPYGYYWTTDFGGVIDAAPGC
jgi:uncharacterized protein YkwD